VTGLAACWADHTALSYDLVGEDVLKEPTDVPAEQRLEIRVAVHQGDVVVEKGDLLGAAVNTAAQLEALAEPGSICISACVYEDAVDNIALYGSGRTRFEEYRAPAARLPSQPGSGELAANRREAPVSLNRVLAPQATMLRDKIKGLRHERDQKCWAGGAPKSCAGERLCDAAV
jgi:class 3 adenylate cyclase